mmetsp:Transcript_98915/g.277018  ORF Transcript_98915/g.277018 Transcript_98915/m.277018 type:complete len:448 (-) Transcript_98915:307-1650(-)
MDEAELPVVTRRRRYSHTEDNLVVRLSLKAEDIEYQHEEEDEEEEGISSNAMPACVCRASDAGAADPLDRAGDGVCTVEGVCPESGEELQPIRRKQTRIRTLGAELSSRSATRLVLNRDHEVPTELSELPTPGWDGFGPEVKNGETTPSKASDSDRDTVFENMSRLASEALAKHEDSVKARKMRSKRKLKTCPSGMIGMASCVTFKSEASSVGGEECPFIIFDWDDTLLPTFHITDVIKPTLESAAYSKVLEDSEFYGPLCEHAEAVRAVLTAARQVGKVGIVTLAAKGWVENSAEWFLPGLDVEALFAELDIPVFYARQYVTQYERVLASVEEGVDLYMIAKRNAMKKCLRRLSTEKAWWKTAHVISVGDSTTEVEAIKEIMWQDVAAHNTIKIIKLVDDPSLAILGMQLKLLSSWFPKVVAYAEDAFISMDANPSSSKIVQSLME